MKIDEKVRKKDKRQYNVDECNDIEKLRKSVKYYRYRTILLSRFVNWYWNMREENQELKSQINEANYVGNLWKKNAQNLWKEKMEKIERESAFLKAETDRIISKNKRALEILNKEPQDCLRCHRRNTDQCAFINSSNSHKRLCLFIPIRNTAGEVLYPDADTIARAMCKKEKKYTYEEFTKIAFDSNTDEKLSEHYQFHLLDARKWAFVRKTPIEQARFYIDDRTGYCRVEVDEKEQ